MASTTNSPGVERSSDAVEEAPAPDQSRTRLFRPGAHVRPDEPVVPAPVVEPSLVEERQVVTKRAHTSPAAALSLVFGVAAAYTALLVFLSPADVVLGAVAVLLGLFGMRAASRVGVTGRWLAAFGMLLGLAALVLGTLTLAGVSTGLNDKGAVDRMQHQVDQWRTRITDANLSDGITG